MTYVDGFVFPVTKKNFSKYKKMASDAGKIWKKFGALQYLECRGEDLNIKPHHGMQIFTFPKLLKPKAGEEIWFSFIVYKSRAHRDAVNKKVHAYMEKKYKDAKNFEMPFDFKRMAYGGFKTEVEY